MTIRLLSFLLFVGFGFELCAQDIHLSQFFTSNNSLNPALTGHYEGDLRLQANYRSQWKQVANPITTSMFAIEKKLPRDKDEFALGLIVINDQVTNLQLNTNKALLSGSYSFYYNKFYFRFGAQGGIVQRSFSAGSQTYPTQWNYSSGNFETSIPNGEGDLKNTNTYAVANAGLAATRIIGRSKITAGYALNHINQPKDNFAGIKNQLPFKHTAHLSSHLYLSPRFNLLPQILFQSAQQATNMVFAALLSYKIKENIALNFGPGYRGSTQNSDAAIGYLGMKYNRFDVGFSFDQNISKLSVDSRSKSAWELSISYTTPSRRIQKVTIPCDRF